jgi:hypothetical protein
VSEEWLGNLLAALISLRIFTLDFILDPNRAPGSKEAYLRFVENVTDRAPHLEYFAVLWDRIDYFWKRFHGEWVPCDSAEFPLHGQLRISSHRFETYH